jgi:hypothetical protein
MGFFIERISLAMLRFSYPLVSGKVNEIMQEKSPLRTGLIILILLLTGVLAFLLFNMMPLLADSSSTARAMPRVRSSITSQVSLPEASDRASERAQRWTQDAKLVKAQGVWYMMGGWDAFETPPVAWTFYYYSPSTKKLATVTIDDENLLWVQPFEIPRGPHALSAFPPNFGSDVAWLSFRAAGGEEFLQTHSRAQVSFHLQEQDSLVWIVTAFDESDYMKVTIDAQTGIVLGQE